MHEPAADSRRVAQPLRRRRLRLVLGLACLCACHAAAARSELELGLLVLNDDLAGSHGIYGPVIESGTHPLGRLDLALDGTRGRARIQGAVAGAHSAELMAKLRAWDGDSLRFDYRRSIRRGDDGLTPLHGSGNVLGLPAGFVPGVTTNALNLDRLTPVTLGLERESYALSGRLFSGTHWKTEAALREQRRRGVVETGAMIGANPGLARAVIVPEPVDQVLRELEASASWDREGRQLRASYQGSLFSADHQTLTWEVPFAADAGNTPFPSNGRMALPPDNQHHRIALDGGMRLGETARLSGTLGLSRMLQNETLVPYSTVASAAAPPRSTAEARVDVLNLALHASARPLPRLTLNASHRYHRSDDRTPLTRFDPVVGDSGSQADSIDAFSRPYDHFRSQTRLRAALRPASGTRLQAEWRHDIVGRDLPGNAGHTRENGLELGFRRNLGDRADMRLTVLQADRRRHGHDAVVSDPATAASCPDTVIVDPDPDGGDARELDLCFSDHPDLRRFMLGERSRQRLRAAFGWFPLDSVDLDFGWSITRDRYRDDIVFDDTAFGLTDVRERMLHAELGWTPGHTWSMHAGYAREYLDSAQNGREIARGAPASILDSTANWRATSNDLIDTVSAGLRADLPDGRTRLEFDWGYIRERNRLSLESRLPLRPLPDDGARRHYAELEATREIDDRLRLKAGLRWERFRAHDRADTGIGEGSDPVLDAILTLRGGDTDYEAVLFWSSLTYTW